MKKSKAKALAEGAVCSLLSLTLVLMGIYVPTVLTMTTILAGIPMMYLGMRRGIRILSASWVIAVLALAVVTKSIFASFLTGLMSFLPGLVLGYTLRIRKTFATIIFSGAAVILFGTVLQLGLLNAMGNGHGIVDMVNQFMDELRNNMDAVLASLEGQLSVTEQDVSVVLNQVIDTTRNIIFLYLPSFLIGSAVVMSYLLFMVSSFVLHRTRPIRIIYQPFWGIYAPKSMCYLALVLFLITSSSEDVNIWMAALRNVLVLLGAYFAVCGVSLIDYKFRKKVSSGYARAVIYCFSLCVGYLFMGTIVQIMCILGIVDGILRFRIREESISHE